MDGIQRRRISSNPSAPSYIIGKPLQGYKSSESDVTMLERTKASRSRSLRSQSSLNSRPRPPRETQGYRPRSSTFATRQGLQWKQQTSQMSLDTLSSLCSANGAARRTCRQLLKWMESPRQDMNISLEASPDGLIT